MRYLITPSLYNSWYWYNKLENASIEDFLKVLRKQKIEKTEAMSKGIKFEDDIFHYCKTDCLPDMEKEAYIDCIKKISNIVKGGNWQEKISKKDNIFNKNVLLYGRTDVILKDTIYDIKFTSRYDIGKYNNSIQHDLYMYCSGIDKFKYLICDGKNVYHEDYNFTEESYSKMREKISCMLEHLFEVDQFKNEFILKWLSK